MLLFKLLTRQNPDTRKICCTVETELKVTESALGEHLVWTSGARYLELDVLYVCCRLWESSALHSEQLAGLIESQVHYTLSN